MKGSEAMTAESGEGSAGRWRTARWLTVGILLLLPWVAMQFTDEVNWTLSDFVVFGVMLTTVGVGYELAVKKTGDAAYRAAVAIALAAAFILVWVNGAVGIIGSEDNDANLMYFLVLAIGITGAAIVRGRPAGLARVLLVTALAQAAVAMVAMIAGLGAPHSGPLEIAALNGFFIALFVGAALLFRHAARKRVERDAT